MTANSIQATDYFDHLLIEHLSEHARQTHAFNFFRSGEPIAALIQKSSEDSGLAFSARVVLSCVLLMAKTGTPEGLAVSDPHLAHLVDTGITELRKEGFVK